MNSHKVIWQEGMLLRPQHFQHNDRYYDQQMRLRSQLTGSYVWGFTKVEIDQQFLASGQIVLNQASGILPDGTVFDLGDRDRPLALEIPANTANKAVYLALPMVTGNCIEVRNAEQPDVLARFTSYTTTVADSNAGEDARTEILCARPEFRLLMEEPQSGHAYVKLKLCHVLVSTPDMAIRLDADFVPSFINAGGSGYLMSCLKEVVGLLEHRGNAIAGRMRPSGQAGGVEVGDFMMLQLINRVQPVLEHYLATRDVHPEILYRTLLALLGELATFGTQSKRPQLDSQYQHNDQGATFGKVMHAIRQALSMVLEQHAIELELQTRQYGVLVSPRVDRQLLGSASFVLAARAQCDAEELRNQLPSHLKVGSVESIRELVSLHLPGIRLRPLAVAPRQIPFHSNKTYFILELSDHEQSQVDTSGGFAFHVSGDFSGLELQFWAIRH
ncbi:type VI secretion system-associated protein [Pseudomonas floridensis]|uniref:Type VI secretion system-associated protein n=1 Tax=Pseudomonas floridensis TaxID=1958950 RepID=A0A1X0MZJ7_9PSED|nr:type VI secretion system baseplate subunit TssK [Pseudomonas floridensis]ORC55776.1 type VI secretion system-associated protein [Pseudomonas floridensis]